MAARPRTPPSSRGDGQDLRLRRRGAAGRHQQKRFTAPDGTVVNEGDVISIDGSTGRVWLGEVPELPSVVRYFEGEIDPEAEADDIVRSVHRIRTTPT